MLSRIETMHMPPTIPHLSKPSKSLVSKTRGESSWGKVYFFPTLFRCGKTMLEPQVLWLIELNRSIAMVQPLHSFFRRRACVITSWTHGLFHIQFHNGDRTSFWVMFRAKSKPEDSRLGGLNCNCQTHPYEQHPKPDNLLFYQQSSSRRVGLTIFRCAWAHGLRRNPLGAITGMANLGTSHISVNVRGGHQRVD